MKKFIAFMILCISVILYACLGIALASVDHLATSAMLFLTHVIPIGLIVGLSFLKALMWALSEMDIL